MTKSPIHPFDLTGKLAVVTGVRRGIGKAIAEALAAAGADIIGVSATLEESRSEVAKRVVALGRSFEGYRVDFADRDAVIAFAHNIDSAGRPVDVLVNNAGIVHRSPAEQHSDEEWDHVLSVDLTSPFVLSREVGRQMIERGSGKIIFVASVLSFQGGMNLSSYVAAKSGIVGLTKALANEWAPRGVNVNAIAPGYIATDINRVYRDDPSQDSSILARIPAGRWGSANDLGGAAVFLASDAADYVSGIVLPVDGGWLGR